MYSLIDFKVMGDERGQLIAIENGAQIPFEIKRVFYIYNTQGDTIRGCHANRKSEFVLVSVTGSCKIKIKLPAGDQDIVLDNPHTGLYLDKMVWKEMYDFSDDAVLLVFSSEVYDKSEYIQDFQEFVKETA